MTEDGFLHQPHKALFPISPNVLNYAASLIGRQRIPYQTSDLQRGTNMQSDISA